jgi:hypothetical protein
MNSQRQRSLVLVPETSHVSTETRLAMLEEELAGLREAMRTRGVIEQAKGMLMIHYGNTDYQAFRVLVRWSSLHNIKLVAVATTLVGMCGGTGELAGSPRPNLEHAVRAALTGVRGR